LFLVVAGLLTLILRKNNAKVRYGLWLAASVKFLIPFSLLVSMGSHLAWPGGSAGTIDGLHFAVGVSQPFTQLDKSLIFDGAPSPGSPSLTPLLPTILAVVWLCGFALVLRVWYVRWRRISAALRESVPLREGREVETLRRLERAGALRKGIEIRLS